MNVLLKPYLAIIFFISTVLFLEFRALSSPVINEFLALNKSTIYDEDGQSSDWIEIFNPNQSAVNLEGYYFTNDSNDLENWTSPDDQLSLNEESDNGDGTLTLTYSISGSVDSKKVFFRLRVVELL